MPVQWELTAGHLPLQNSKRFLRKIMAYTVEEKELAVAP